MRARIAATATVLVSALALQATSAVGYVPMTLSFASGVAVVAHWPADAFPATVTVTPGLSTDVPESTELPALTAALNSWSAVGSSAAAVMLGTEAPVEAGVIDGINAIEFSNDPALDLVSAISMTFLVTDDQGQILEADILVNDRLYDFGIDEGDETLDLQTVMTRELGHFLGLDNSPLGRPASGGTINEDSSVMYPLPRGTGAIARELRADDVAAISALYPSGSDRGSISGTVTAGGAPVFGAHVIAFEPIDGILVGAVTLPDGSYTIGGLPPGRYVLRAEPLATPAGPSTLGGLFADAADDIDTDFGPAFLPRAVDVQAGGQVTDANLEVR